MKAKKTVEIEGRKWLASYPFCGGCTYLVPLEGCTYNHKGCAYPGFRGRRPQDFVKAFIKMADQRGLSLEELADDLGNCLDIVQ